MKKLLIVILLVCISLPVYASRYKMNYYTGRWEYAQDNESLRHNPYSNSWSYEKPDSRIMHNPYENTWSYEEDDDNDGYGY